MTGTTEADRVRYNLVECACGCRAIRFTPETFGRIVRCAAHPGPMTWRQVKQEERHRIWKHRRLVTNTKVA